MTLRELILALQEYKGDHDVEVAVEINGIIYPTGTCLIRGREAVNLSEIEIDNIIDFLDGNGICSAIECDFNDDGKYCPECIATQKSIAIDLD